MTLANFTEIHAQLSSQTSDAHKALHEHPKISRLMADDFTENAYYSLLTAYGEYYRYVEHCRSQLHVWPELSLESALSHIDTDLSHQQQYWYSNDVLGEWQKSDALSCLGMLYVLHGASLGGQVIAKRLRQTLPNVSTAFFQFGVGMEQWKTLLSTLENNLQTQAQLDVVIASARHTFVAFGLWVDEKA